MRALSIAEQLRDAQPGIKVLLNCGGGSFKSQFKKADKSGASMAFIIGEDELKNQHVVIKFLRDEREQMTMAITELPQFLQTQLKDLV